jgi:hypothetical protein
MKNYYATLGVTPQAPPEVIRAAYRALAQRYHPDRFEGSKDEAHRIMSDINEAYSILSDPEKRRVYDEQNSAAGDYDDGDDTANEGLNQLLKDWQTAANYFPDLLTIETALARTSKRLAFCYVLVMMSAKEFGARREIAQAMQDDFLRSYFGDRAEIVEFAKSLIDSGKKQAARELNEAVRVLGAGLDSGLVITKICSKFGLPIPVSQSVRSTLAVASEVRVFNCPRCKQSLRYRQAGPDKCRCPRCKTTFRIGFDTSIYDVGCAWEGD